MLAARKTNLITARARKVKRSARMLANARKDHSIPLSGCEGLSDPNNLCERGSSFGSKPDSRSRLIQL